MQNSSSKHIKLSRRQVLRTLGIGTGILAFLSLPGCYNNLRNPLRNTLDTEGKLSKSKEINKLLVEDTRKNWKAVFDSLEYTPEGSKRASKKKIQAAITASITLVNHLDEIGFNAEVDEMLQSADLKDDRLADLDALTTGLKKISMPQDMITRMQLSWMEGDRQTAIQHISQEGGVSAHSKHLLMSLQDFVNAPSAKLGLYTIPQSLPNGDSIDLDHHSGCAGTAAACAASFAVAALICAGFGSGTECDNSIIIADVVCTLAAIELGCKF